MCLGVVCVCACVCVCVGGGAYPFISIGSFDLAYFYLLTITSHGKYWARLFKANDVVT